MEQTAIFNNKPVVMATITITAVKFTRYVAVIHTGTARNRTILLRFLAFSAMLRPGSRVCNSMRKITEIVKDYGGVANGCQLTEVWPVGQKTSNEG